MKLNELLAIILNKISRKKLEVLPNISNIVAFAFLSFRCVLGCESIVVRWNKWYQRIICTSLSDNQVIIWHSIILIRHFCKCCRNQLNQITNRGISFVLIMHCFKSKTNYLHVRTSSVSLLLSLSLSQSLSFIFCISNICVRSHCA